MRCRDTGARKGESPLMGGRGSPRLLSGERLTLGAQAWEAGPGLRRGGRSRHPSESLGSDTEPTSQAAEDEECGQSTRLRDLVLGLCGCNPAEHRPGRQDSGAVSAFLCLNPPARGFPGGRWMSIPLPTQETRLDRSRKVRGATQPAGYTH